VTLTSDVEHAPYSGMLPGHISGIYSREEMFIDLRQLCDFSGARFVHSHAYVIDLKRKQVLIGFHGSTLPADVISINTGGTSCMAGVAGASRMGNSNEARTRLAARLGTCPGSSRARKNANCCRRRRRRRSGTGAGNAFAAAKRS